MKLRSLLFVPADSERKLAKSTASAADVLILDLEDAVAEARKPMARAMAAEFISVYAAHAGAKLFVRINPLDTPLAMSDLAAVVLPGLRGIVLPKIRGMADVVHLGHALDALEARAGIASGSVAMLPVATETPQALLGMCGFSPHARLAGVTWGAEDLSSAIGALSNKDESGAFDPLYQWAASLCLTAAAAAGVAPIDTMYGDFRDAKGLDNACRISRRRGFRGRIAIHPDQVDTINEAYTPSEGELAQARRIVDAFAAQPEAGTLAIDGVMVDRPHLTQALRTIGAL